MCAFIIWIFQADEIMMFSGDHALDFFLMFFSKDKIVYGYVKVIRKFNEHFDVGDFSFILIFLSFLSNTLDRGIFLCYTCMQIYPYKRKFMN